jgi:hypothetical protein
LRIGQQADIEQYITNQFRRLTPQRDALFEEAVTTAARVGAERILPIARIVGADVPLNTVIASSHRAVEWLDKYIAQDGINLSHRLWAVDKGAQSRVIETLRNGIAQGEAVNRSARDLLAGGPPTGETVRTVQSAFGRTSAARVGKNIEELFTTTGQRNLVFNVNRVLITETNRATGHAFRDVCKNAQNAVGMGWRLSPAHPRHDICDDYADANSHGLGRGNYPFNALPPYPAHPLCMCHEEPVFKGEVG